MSSRRKPPSRSPLPPKPHAADHTGELLASMEDELMLIAPKSPALVVLKRLGKMRQILDQAMSVNILLAHRAGASWAQIGAALNVSPQAVEQRMSRLGSTFVERYSVKP